MTTHRFHSLITIVTLACFLVVAWSVPAEAQKKQKAKTPPKVQQKETPREEPKEEPKEEQEEQAEEPVTVPVTTSVNLPNKFIDVLKQHIGEKTNMGILRKFAGDYIIFEDENITTLVPLASIQTVLLVKDEDTSQTRLELKLIAKD